MKKNKRSKTAEAVAAVRAYHLLYQDSVVFEDPYAIQLTSLTWRIFLKIRTLNWLLMKTLHHGLLPVFAAALGRACYAEEQLDKAQERLQVLDKACYFGCDEFDELEEAIEVYRSQNSS